MMHAVVAATAGVVVVLAGCSSRSEPVATIPPTIAPDRLESLLLTVQEANALLGSSGMVLVGPVNRQTFTKNLPTSVSNPECLSTANVALDPVYAGSGYTAIVEHRFQDSGPDFQPTHILDQAVASFASTAAALAFVTALADKWKACAGQAITVQTVPTSGGVFSEQRYTTGNLVGSVPNIALSKTDGARTCQRALSALSNLVVDVEVCTSPLNDQGYQVANKIAAKAKEA